MPRSSQRAKRIKRFKDFLHERLRFRVIREFSGEEDEDEDDFDEFVAVRLHEAETTRYHAPRGPYRKSNRSCRFEEHLDDDESDDHQPWLNENEFRQKYRMSRESFHEIVKLIENHPVFHKRARSKKRKKGKAQRSPSHQLMVLLKFLGTEGTGGSNPDMRDIYAIGEGSVQNNRDRAVTALRSLKNQVVTWPDEEERKVISRRIFKEFGWPNCVGIADGTLFPLAFRPTSEDAADYSGRKYAYSLNAMIISDDQRLIRMFLAGWPGSCHDDRVFKKLKLSLNPLRYFSPREYLLGDSAFTNNWFIVSAYRKPFGMVLPRAHEYFNDKEKPVRAISEHTIGILKGRFPWLRSIRTIITDDPKSIKRILEYIDACIILHNLLVKRNDEIPDEWIDDDEFSDIDDDERAPVPDSLNEAIPEGAPNDLRRTQLMVYLNENP